MKDHQRYYLHRCIKAFARIQLRNRKGIISLPYSYKLNTHEKKWLQKLIAQGYSVQLALE